MGLAASQARFLAITARKADCEFRSMQIAQNKLSITRQLAQASSDYQNSMNATKLVWDYDCAGEKSPCENAAALSYKSLLTPSFENNYQPYLVTTRTGALVLDGKLAKAAAVISPNGGPATRSSAGFQAFLAALNSSGAINGMDYAGIKELFKTTEDSSGYYVYRGKDGTYVYDHKLKLANAEDKVAITEHGLNTGEYDPETNTEGWVLGYDSNAGFGSTPLAKNGFVARNIYGLEQELKKQGCPCQALIKNLGDGGTYSGTSTDGDCYRILVNSSTISKDEAQNLTVGDLLSKEVVFAYTLPDNKDVEKISAYSNVGDNKISENAVKQVAEYANNEANFTGNVEGMIENIVEALKEVMDNDALIKKAGDKLKDKVKNSGALAFANLHYKENNDTAGALFAAATGATDNIAYFVGYTKSNKLNSSVGFSLSNALKYILTYVANEESKLNDYTLNTKVSECDFVTDDSTYTYAMKKKGVGSDTLLKTDFYMQIYNNICVNGWKAAASNIDQNGIFEQLIKNGTYFISSIGEDGYFYQQKYNNVDCMFEVKDEDAIARAEAEFQALKAQLTYKEDKLDLDAKNLETEINSLSTELDSVKNLISKGVENTFKMFQ